jgi:hypothetical protein
MPQNEATLFLIFLGIDSFKTQHLKYLEIKEWQLTYLLACLLTYLLIWHYNQYFVAGVATGAPKSRKVPSSFPRKSP